MFAHRSLYPVVDVDVCHGRSLDPLAVAEACLRGGARVLQVRQKGGSSRDFLALARRVVAAARPHGALVIVNDRGDIARLAAAGGVHVGQDDLQVEDARTMVGQDAVVGLSTHDAAQVDDALKGSASYIAVGPIYPTSTKDTGYTARGLELLRYAAGRGTPVVAIGGITLDRVPELLAAGADAVAVITDLLSTGDVEARVRAYGERI